MVEPLLSGIILGLMAVTLLGLLPGVTKASW